MTNQRANPPPGRGHALLSVLLALLLMLSVSCAHTLGGNAINVRVECNIGDASVWIDDVLVGTAKSWQSERSIRAGFHRFELRHPGYYSFFQEVELEGGSHVVIKAPLRELVE